MSDIGGCRPVQGRALLADSRRPARGPGPAASGAARVLAGLWRAARRAFVCEDRVTLDWLDFERGRIVRLHDRALREALRRREDACRRA